jgi:hypothetical protein
VYTTIRQDTTKLEREVMDLIRLVRKTDQLDMIAGLEMKLVMTREQRVRAEDALAGLDVVAVELGELGERIGEMNDDVKSVVGRLRGLCERR